MKRKFVRTRIVGILGVRLSLCGYISVQSGSRLPHNESASINLNHQRFNSFLKRLRF